MTGNIKNKHNQRMKETAFSLIEVLVALVLLALSMGAVMTSFSGHSFQIEFQRDRFHANRVAMHVAGEYYLLNKWPDIGHKTGRVDVGKTQWEWRANVIATSEKKMRRVEIGIANESNPDQILAKHVLFVTNPQFK